MEYHNRKDDREVEAKIDETQKSKRASGRRKHNGPAAAKSSYWTGVRREGANEMPKGDHKLIEAVSNLSFYNPLGLAIEHNVEFTGPNYPVTSSIRRWDNQKLWVPGFFGIDWVPTYGTSVDAQSPLNVATQRLFAEIRAKNSGRINYDQTTLGLYLVAVEQPYLFYSLVKRVYGAATVYSRNNRYLPRAIIQFMGFDPDDILGGQFTKWTSFLITAAAKLNQLRLPDLEIYKRHFWFNSNLYTDSEDISKAQLYVFRQAGYYKLAYDDVGLKYYLQANTIPVAQYPLLKLSDVEQIFNAMIDPLITNSDFATISGDIEKAGMPMLSVGELDVNYTTSVVYNPEVLLEISNSTATPIFFEETEINDGEAVVSCDITQVVVESPSQFAGTRSYLSQKIITNGIVGYTPYLNTDNNSPSVDEVFTMARLNPTWKYYAADTDNNDQYWQADAYSDVMITRYVIGSFGLNTVTHEFGLQWLDFQSAIEFSASSLVGIYDSVRLMSAIAHFDWAPLVYFCETYAVSGVNYLKANLPFGQFMNYRVTTYEELKRIHDASILVQFGLTDTL